MNRENLPPEFSLTTELLLFPNEWIPLSYSGWIPYITICSYAAYLLTTPITNSTNSFYSDMCKTCPFFTYKNIEWHIVYNLHSHAMYAKCCNVIIVNILWTMTVVFCFFHPLTALSVIHYWFNLILKLTSHCYFWMPKKLYLHSS